MYNTSHLDGCRQRSCSRALCGGQHTTTAVAAAVCCCGCRLSGRFRSAGSCAGLPPLVVLPSVGSEQPLQAVPSCCDCGEREDDLPQPPSHGRIDRGLLGGGRLDRRANKVQVRQRLIGHYLDCLQHRINQIAIKAAKATPCGRLH